MSDVADWWKTSIIDMEPGRIELRGNTIQDLIGNISFPDMIWMMVRGDRPTEAQSKLFEAALVSAVDHGPQAPSIAAARMAVTCGLPLNNAMASAVNMLGDVHGGAGEQAVELFHFVISRTMDLCQMPWPHGKTRVAKSFQDLGIGFTNPRIHVRPRLMELADQAVGQGACDGKFAQIAQEIETVLREQKARPFR
jgi:citrate synthase